MRTWLSEHFVGVDSEIVGPEDELNPMQRSFLISRAETIYGGTNEIHRNTIAERVLGLPRRRADLRRRGFAVEALHLPWA